MNGETTTKAGLDPPRNETPPDESTPGGARRKALAPLASGRGLQRILSRIEDPATRQQVMDLESTCSQIAHALGAELEEVRQVIAVLAGETDAESERGPSELQTLRVRVQALEQTIADIAQDLSDIAPNLPTFPIGLGGASGVGENVAPIYRVTCHKIRDRVAAVSGLVKSR